VSKNIEQLAEELSGLTVLEMSKLKTVLEDKWGVKPQMGFGGAMMMAPQAAAGAPQAAAESTEFQVTLAEVPADKKIGVIKVIRELTSLGLKEAKDMADGAPKEVKASASKAEAEEMKKKLEAAGAKVTLKGL
jgi:large subunit ribosomal protein L7/L12